MAALNKKRFIVAVFILMLLFFLIANSKRTALAVNDNLNLSTNVQEYLILNITSGGTVDFGDLIPGTPKVGPSGGSVISVITNSNEGYNLAFSDASDTDSILSQSGTYISDMKDGSTAITTPAAWSLGTHVGLGITLVNGSAKDAEVWGTGTAYDDVLNKYRGIPASANTMYGVTGYHEAADISTWGFKLDAPNNQKTGAYSGNLVVTATGVWN